MTYILLCYKGNSSIFNYHSLHELEERTNKIYNVSKSTHYDLLSIVLQK